jgi:endonuclease/exonuclease/phosphatase family metal-dependent hydrolase
MQARRLVVASYNVEWFFTSPPFGLVVASVADKARKLGAVLAQLQPRPMVVGLQEVQSEVELKALCDELRLRHQLEYRPLCARTVSARTGQRVAMLVDEAQVQVDRWDSYANMEKNVWLDGRLRSSGDRFHLVNVHLKADFDKQSTFLRESEARILRPAIAAHREADKGAATVLLGDFNDFDLAHDGPNVQVESGVLRGLRFDNTLANVMPHTPGDSTVYGTRIDHVLYDPAKLEWISGKLLTQPDTETTPLAERTSDHFALLAEFRFKN